MMMPVLWNNVPDNIQLTMTQKAFRKTIKVISFDICVSMIRPPLWKSNKFESLITDYLKYLFLNIIVCSGFDILY